MNKTWCKHIKTRKGEFDRRSRWIYYYNENYLIPVPRTWKICPVCESERPTRANIAAATLRYLMDNDQ